jgi:hypothetical protein
VIFVSFVVHFGRVERFVREKAAHACACTHADRSRGKRYSARRRFHQPRHTFSPSQRRQDSEFPRYLVGGEGFAFSISISIAIAIPISMIAMIQ